jgi:hypothetical protein
MRVAGFDRDGGPLEAPEASAGKQSKRDDLFTIQRKTGSP